MKCLESLTARDVAEGFIAHPLVFSAREHRMLWIAMSRMQGEGITEAAEAARSMPWEDVGAWLSTYASLEWRGQLADIDKESSNHLRRLQATQWEDGQIPLLDELGGYSGLSDLAARAAPIPDVEGACRRLVTLYQIRYTRRRLMALSDELGKPEALEKWGETQEHLTILGSSTPEDASDEEVGIGNYAASMVDAEPEPADTGAWPLPALNTMVPMDRNGVYVLAAFPGRGKTTFALEAATKTCRHRGYEAGAVAMFSMEMDRRELTTKLMARAAGCSIREVQDRSWETWQRERAREAMERLGDSLVLNDVSTVTAKGIARWARKHAKRHPAFHTLVIDYLQLMQGPQDKEYDRLSDITRHLAILRKELNIAIVLLSQLNRESDKGKPREPRLSDLRGSGSIEQDATAVMFLHSMADTSAPGDWTGHVLVPKNRNGPTGKVGFTFRRSIGQFDQGIDDRVSDIYGIADQYNKPPPADVPINNEREDLFH